MPKLSTPPVTYQPPDSIGDFPIHYCPSCAQSVIHKLIAEVIDELGIRECSIAITPAACAVYLYNYFNFDVAESAQGRAPAIATGLKRVQPNKIVFTYQSDGDLAASGLAQTVWAATRGENITIFFINNAIYEFTNGHRHSINASTQFRTASSNGHETYQAATPIGIAELLAGLPGATYVVRRAVHNSCAVQEAKKAIYTALQVQRAAAGFSLVEFMSSCSTNGTSAQCGSLNQPKPAPFYPLGDYKVADIVKNLN
ncbi:MAG: thiamine pyrophosphate-dependent enzyme [Anaerolineae bacterium]